MSLTVLPQDDDFPPGVREIIAKALPVYRNPETYDMAKRLMDAATIIGGLRQSGFKIVRTRV